ncbi:unnamed protein product [Nesidiocoris tenuis]|uniref:Uncharacterized protein n=1 Tax=Nesidiocoris tenuis TaxID=355587 RepID=A0A6H5FWB5_9HEMI|nr:unnamed protein product [Nesidiocoris tenuis]
MKFESARKNAHRLGDLDRLMGDVVSHRLNSSEVMDGRLRISFVDRETEDSALALEDAEVAFEYTRCAGARSFSHRLTRAGRASRSFRSRSSSFASSSSSLAPSSAPTSSSFRHNGLQRKSR